MSKDEREVVLRRIVVEYGRNYAYAYMTDANARVMDEEVLWYATARDEPKEEQSEEPPEKD